MSNNLFKKRYNQMFPNEEPVISKTLYGRHKFKVLASMTIDELRSAFKNNTHFGDKIKAAKTKAKMMTIFKQYSGFI